jgi:hypothetical protein
LLAGPTVTRPCPDATVLRLASTRTERRILRKSDCSAAIEGRRFEVPNRYRHLSVLEVRFAAWDLTQVHLVDPHTGTALCRLFPQDKAANASGLRRSVQPITTDPVTLPPPPARGIGPLLAPMIDRQAATGLPPPTSPRAKEMTREQQNARALLSQMEPVHPRVPTEALHVSTRLESVCWRVQQLAGDGGFALLTGAPGCGKSAALPTQRDVTVGVISRPQANIADFYRAMGELFGVELRPHNRYGGAKTLRRRWQAQPGSGGSLYCRPNACRKLETYAQGAGAWEADQTSAPTPTDLPANQNRSPRGSRLGGFLASPMPRTFAYVRVSTTGQTTEKQIQEIEPAGFKLDPRRIVSETVSGSSAIEQRPGFIKLLNKLCKVAVTRSASPGRRSRHQLSTPI